MRIPAANNCLLRLLSLTVVPSPTRELIQLTWVLWPLCMLLPAPRAVCKGALLCLLMLASSCATIPQRLWNDVMTALDM